MRELQCSLTLCGRSYTISSLYTWVVASLTTCKHTFFLIAQIAEKILKRWRFGSNTNQMQMEKVLHGSDLIFRTTSCAF